MVRNLGAETLLCHRAMLSPVAVSSTLCTRCSLHETGLKPGIYSIALFVCCISPVKHDKGCQHLCGAFIVDTYLSACCPVEVFNHLITPGGLVLFILVATFRKLAISSVHSFDPFFVFAFSRFYFIFCVEDYNILLFRQSRMLSRYSFCRYPSSVIYFPTLPSSDLPLFVYAATQGA